MNRAWSRYCFAAAAVFLLLSGTVLRLLMGGAVGAEVANLLVPVAVAAVFWIRISRWGSFLSWTVLSAMKVFLIIISNHPNISIPIPA